MSPRDDRQQVAGIRVPVDPTSQRHVVGRLLLLAANLGQRDPRQRVEPVERARGTRGQLRQEIPAPDVGQLVQQGRREPVFRPSARIGGQEDHRLEDSPGHRDLARTTEDQPHAPAHADSRREPIEKPEHRGLGDRRRVPRDSPEAPHAGEYRHTRQERPNGPGAKGPGCLPDHRKTASHQGNLRNVRNESSEGVGPLFRVHPTEGSSGLPGRGRRQGGDLVSPAAEGFGLGRGHRLRARRDHDPRGGLRPERPGDRERGQRGGEHRQTQRGNDRDRPGQMPRRRRAPAQHQGRERSDCKQHGRFGRRRHDERGKPVHARGSPQRSEPSGHRHSPFFLA